MKTRNFFVLFVLVSSFVQMALAKGKLNAQAIYGADNRQDWVEVTDPKLLNWARSTAALFPGEALTAQGSNFVIEAETYQSAAGLCSDQKFLQQLTPAFCSGFLVGPDLLLTAGHCISGPDECAATKFVFDFAMTGQPQSGSTAQASQVFTCKSLVSRQRTNTVDYALIRLDRPAIGRTPFPVRRSGNPSTGTRLTMIGHPAGLPSKISDDGKVLRIDDKIVADVDAFGGNSGSAVINRATGSIEGILVEGAQDYESRGSCNIEHRCGSDCEGERIFPVSKIATIIPQ
jgi:Trypsin-like peptidase domain